MKQYVKIFSKIYTYENPLEVQVNEFLRNHPNYEISTISHSVDSKTCNQVEYLCVLFNIKENS